MSGSVILPRRARDRTNIIGSKAENNIGRRDFLKGAAAFGLAVVIAPAIMPGDLLNSLPPHSIPLNSIFTGQTGPTGLAGASGPTDAAGVSNWTYYVYADGSKYAAKKMDGTVVHAADADPGHVIQACITDAGTAPFTLVLEPGTNFAYTSTVPAFNKDATDWQKIMGHGATITLSSGAPSAFFFNRTGDYDTFQNIWLEGFTVDCNSVAGTQTHVVLGTTVGTSDWFQRTNFQHINILNIKTVNVPVGADQAHSRLNVWIAVYHPTYGEKQTYMKHIYIEDCDFSGGNYGVGLLGIAPDASSTGLNVYFDDIHIHRCRHTLGSIPTTTFWSEGFGVVNNGFGGFVHIADCFSEYGGDTGMEVNNANALIENCIVKDNTGTGFAIINYNTPAYADEQLVTFKNCHVQKIDITGTAGPGYGWLAETANPSSAPAISMGSVVLEDCDYFSSTSSFASGEALTAYLTAGLASLTLTNFKATIQNANSSSGTKTVTPIYINPTGGTLYPLIKLENVSVSISGANTGAEIAVAPINLEGNIVLDVDGVTVDDNVSGHGTSGNTYGLVIGADTSNITGSIRRLQILRMDVSDPYPIGIYVGGTGTLTVATQILVEGCDFSVPVANGGPGIYYAAPSNVAQVYEVPPTLSVKRRS